MRSYSEQGLRGFKNLKKNIFGICIYIFFGFKAISADIRRKAFDFIERSEDIAIFFFYVIIQTKTTFRHSYQASIYQVKRKSKENW
jgi:hypothetical protein